MICIILELLGGWIGMQMSNANVAGRGGLTFVVQALLYVLVSLIKHNVLSLLF